MAAAKKAATPAKAPPRPQRVRLKLRDDGDVVASWPVHAYRFLFADGTVLNVESPCNDGSVLREAVLAMRNVAGDRIEGIAMLGCVGWTVAE